MSKENFDDLEKYIIKPVEVPKETTVAVRPRIQIGDNVCVSCEG